VQLLALHQLMAVDLRLVLAVFAHQQTTWNALATRP